LPVAVQAVLLPFDGKIIYDGLLNTYSVTFGSGIRRSLDIASRNAQEREGIITSLLPLISADEERRAIRSRNTKILAAFRTALYKSGLSTKMVERHLGTIESFANDYLLQQEPPRGLLEMSSEDLEDYLAGARSSATRGDTETQKAVVTGFKRFTRFLADSERIAWDTAADLHALLAARR
jgi:hypothetical protein